MTQEQLTQILSKVAGLARALAETNVQPFEAAFDDLLNHLEPMLPAKADGSPFTDAELAAAADAARAPFRDVLERNG